jgi:hypothetical protein
MVVRQRLLERANPVSGRLRSWLLSALQNFLANARRYETRQKRGAGVDVLPLDHGESCLSWRESPRRGSPRRRHSTAHG